MAFVSGKESAVLHASRGLGTSTAEHFAIKVYKMTLDNFKNRVAYVKDDFRFKNPRRVMKVWAEKEFLNLKRYYFETFSTVVLFIFLD